jgi:hypothetical protein
MVCAKLHSGYTKTTDKVGTMASKKRERDCRYFSTSGGGGVAKFANFLKLFVSKKVHFFLKKFYFFHKFY